MGNNPHLAGGEKNKKLFQIILALYFFLLWRNLFNLVWTNLIFLVSLGRCSNVTTSPTSPTSPAFPTSRMSLTSPTSPTAPAWPRCCGAAAHLRPLHPTVVFKTNMLFFCFPFFSFKAEAHAVGKKWHNISERCTRWKHSRVQPVGCKVVSNRCLRHGGSDSYSSFF